MADHDTVCFTCGNPVAEDPFENRLEDGSACPACRDRLLDQVPSLLPSEEEVESEEGHALSVDPLYDPDDPIGA